MGFGHFLSQKNSSVEHIDSSSSADGCVLVLCGSGLVLVVLSVRIPTDVDISWIVSCVSRLLKACLKMF